MDDGHIPYYHPAWIEIDLKQFKINLSIIKKNVPDSLLCLPVKANAYGHGLVAMAKTAVNGGVDYLAVSCLQEGILLREEEITLPILVMGAIHEDQIPSLLKYNLDFSISSHLKATMVSKVCSIQKKSCRVHIEVDTGMQRTGMRPHTALALLKELSHNPWINVVGIYSHMATADQPNHAIANQQISIFNQVVDEARLFMHHIIAHLANSGGVVHYPSSYFDMIRPGILALGYYHHATSSFADIKPFLSLKAKVSYFKVVPKDSGISYGHNYKTNRDSRIITVPVGYGDGYRRSLSNMALVLIHGKLYPVVGNICMDQCMVDIGDDAVFVGDEVSLIGDHPHISLNDIAKLCHTIPYEILCNLSMRLPRVYLS